MTGDAARSSPKGRGFNPRTELFFFRGLDASLFLVFFLSLSLSPKSYCFLVPSLAPRGRGGFRVVMGESAAGAKRPGK